jgi:UDP-N-acetylglucosamine acyltransferase
VSRIHPTALVDAGARIADDVDIGAYTIVGAHVTIGAATRIGPHAVITGRTTIGARNRIFQFASVGEIPQDRKFGGEPTTTTLGDDNVVREFVTIHAGTAQDRGATTIGNGNWFLAYTHVAHDCVVGNFTTFSNNAQIAGHVTIGDFAVLGAYAGVHQFCRIGAHAFLAAGAIVLQDVPPYVTAAGYPAKPAGTNNEGLRRRGFSASEIATVRRAYRTLYRAGLSLERARDTLAEAARDAPLLAPLVAFLAESGRGIVR